ncbi:MAG: hypothetical protein IKI33_03970, partial [Eubacterium sp.]|nr:hypothetical protein [Eubacterium sp.]
MKTLKYLKNTFIISVIMICLVELVLLFLDWWYQGVLFSYYQEKYSFGYAIQFKDKGVIFNEYA